jgi:hypothetical protein
MMSLERRLDALERTGTGTAQGGDADLCPECGGVTLAVVFRIMDVLDGDQDDGMTVDEAKRISTALDEAPAACRRCGGATLAGTLRDMAGGSNEPG